MPDDFNSGRYWEKRYARGQTSGSGSYGRLAEFKAEFLNAFVERMQVPTVLEFGCGDGNQVSLSRYPYYIGVDVSRTAIELCRERFKGDDTKRFVHISEYAGQTAELTLSLDVVYHLVEESVFVRYMEELFDSSTKYVIVYSSNFDRETPRNSHIRHRKVTAWIATHRPDFALIAQQENAYPLRDKSRGGPRDGFSPADFYVYERVSGESD